MTTPYADQCDATITRDIVVLSFKEVGEEVVRVAFTLSLATKLSEVLLRRHDPEAQANLDARR